MTTKGTAITIVEQVENKVGQFKDKGQINLPSNYSLGNALRAAWLAIQQTTNYEKKPALDVCTRESVANALMDMTIQGLNPAKNQCAFVVFGNKLVCMREYFGTMMLAEETAGVIAKPGVIYEGDIFKYSLHGKYWQLDQHETAFENIDKNKLVGAYCRLFDKNTEEEIHIEVMTMEQIKQSWRMSPAKPFNDKGELKAGTPHFNQPDQMAMRTVVNRACKPYINKSNDSNIFQEAVSRADEIAAEYRLQEEIEENANKETLSLEDGREVDVESGEITEEPTVVETVVETVAETTAEEPPVEEPPVETGQQDLGF